MQTDGSNAIDNEIISMKNVLSLLFGLVLCSANGIAGEYFSVQKQWEGIDREYLIFLPEQYKANENKLFPVVFGLHGYTGTASGFEKETTKGMNLFAEQQGIVLVYPQGSHFNSIHQGEPWFISSWNDVVTNADQKPSNPRKCLLDRDEYPRPPECREFNFCAWTSCYDDLGFLKSILLDVSANYRVDEKRRYMVGMSNGGAMSYRFSCLYPDLLSASAIVGSTVPISNSCSRETKLPLLIIYGSADSTTPADGSPSTDGFVYEPASVLFDSWAENMNCNDTAIKSNLKHSEDRGINCIARRECELAGKEVQVCEIPGGEHYWPGQNESVGFCSEPLQNDVVNSSSACEKHYESINWGNEMIWDFLKKHRKG